MLWLQAVWTCKKKLPKECAWTDIYAFTAKVGDKDHLGWVVKAKVKGQWKRQQV